MSAAPPNDKVPEATATISAPATGFGAILGGLAVLPIVFLIVFHAGAAYLSYQKYQSGLWAFVNFLFAYFYYPYYAFFLAGTPASVEPSPINTMMGGLRRMMKSVRKY
jgi:hypothetical protein